ncbi:MAG: hypothetical protein ACSLFA_16420 [Mycobacterium sp.]
MSSPGVPPAVFAGIDGVPEELCDRLAAVCWSLTSSSVCAEEQVDQLAQAWTVRDRDGEQVATFTGFRYC